MKKLLSILLVLLCVATSALAAPWRVFDNAGLFSEKDITEIEQAISDFQNNTGCAFYVLTTDDYLGYKNWATIADSFYYAENPSWGMQVNGMVYYIDMNQRVPYISTFGKMSRALADGAISAAHDDCHSFLVAGEYKSAVFKMIDIAAEAYETYKTGR